MKRRKSSLIKSNNPHLAGGELFTIFAILVGLYFSVAFCFSAVLYLSISIYLFIYLFICLSIDRSIYLSIYIYIYIHYRIFLWIQPCLRRKCGWGLMILISVGRTPPNI